MFQLFFILVQSIDLYFHFFERDLQAFFYFKNEIEFFFLLFQRTSDIFVQFHPQVVIFRDLIKIGLNAWQLVNIWLHLVIFLDLSILTVQMLKIKVFSNQIGADIELKPRKDYRLAPAKLALVLLGHVTQDLANLLMVYSS